MEGALHFEPTLTVRAKPIPCLINQITKGKKSRTWEVVKGSMSSNSQARVTGHHDRENFCFIKRYPFHLRRNISSHHPQRLISFWKMQDYGKITTQMLSTRAISVRLTATAKPSDPIIKKRRSITTISFLTRWMPPRKSSSKIEEDKQIKAMCCSKHQRQEHRKPQEQEHLGSGNVRIVIWRDWNETYPFTSWRSSLGRSRGTSIVSSTPSRSGITIALVLTGIRVSGKAKVRNVTYKILEILKGNFEGSWNYLDHQRWSLQGCTAQGNQE